jgi:hypothetical protein
VSVDACRECRTLPALVDVLRSTPYGEVAAAMLRAHADDLLAVELGLDRWTTRAIAHAADALDDREAAARSLALAIVTERDLEWLRRGPRAFGLSSDAVAGSLVSLPRDCPHEALRALAAWTADEGPIRRVLPRRLARLAPSVADWDGLLLAARRARRAACRRAFAGQPFCLAPALALLLFKEEELRTIDAIAEAGGTGSTIALEAAIAASAMGG